MKEVKAHETKHTFTEIEEYPEHEQREVSAEFERNRKQLLEVDQRPCFVCDLLDLPPSRHPLEAHHFLCEWATWYSADPVKMQKLFDLGVIDFYGYSKKLKGCAVKSPDDIRNLLILCAKHHRASGIGIHATTGPLWFSQSVAKDGIDILKGSDTA